MYETLVRPIEVFQIPPLQPISVVSEKLKKSELKREDKRLRQIAANKATASAKRKRDAAGTDGDDIGRSLNTTEVTDGTGNSSTNKRVKMEEDIDLFMTEQDDDVPQEEQNMDLDVKVETTIEGPSTSAVPAAAADISTTTTPLPLPTPHATADISTVTTAPTKINISKALPEVRGHTSYLTFACLIPTPGSTKAPCESKVLSSEVLAEKTSV